MKSNSIPDHPVDVANELKRRMQPAAVLKEIITGAAFKWSVAGNHHSDGDDNAHAWFEQLPGETYGAETDPDYRGLHPVDAILLGIADQFQEAFDDLCRAVAERNAWEEEQRKGVARC